jgi:hypothetical protein
MSVSDHTPIIGKAHNSLEINGAAIEATILQTAERVSARWRLWFYKNRAGVGVYSSALT